jgi:hypothetical protein
LLSAFIFLIRGKKIDTNYFKVTGVFLIIELLQYFSFQSFVLETFLSLFIKLSFAYFCVRCIEGNFYGYFVQFMKVVCSISLFFYGASFIPGFYDFVYFNITPFFTPPFYKTADFFTAQRNIIIYTFAYDCFLTMRNPGPFWEPGIFSIFIILALLFNVVQQRNLKGRTNVLFIVSVLTTLSTAGYLGLFFVIFFYFLSNSRVRFKFLYVLITAFVAVYAYYNLPFLAAKVKANAEMVDYTGSRFGSLAADWALFINSPWIGWGRGLMRFGGESSAHFTQDFHRNNGLASLLTQYGVFLVLIYFFWYHLSLRYLCRLHQYSGLFGSYALIVILFVSFSQVIYTRQFFLAFLFLGLHLQKLNPSIVKERL